MDRATPHSDQAARKQGHKWLKLEKQTADRRVTIGAKYAKFWLSPMTKFVTRGAKCEWTTGIFTKFMATTGNLTPIR